MSTHDIDPGTLELFVLGALSAEESERIRERVAANDALKEATDRLEAELESLAWQGRVEPPAYLRERVMARIAQQVAFPSLLRGATAIDLAPWVQALAAPEDQAFDNLHIAPIEGSAAVPSAVVWVRTHVEEEVHTDVLESFLILEGTCEVLMQGQVISMGPGDAINIPLHTPHSVRVTSATPCKAVVQRLPVAV